MIARRVHVPLTVLLVGLLLSVPLPSPAHPALRAALAQQPPPPAPPAQPPQEQRRVKAIEIRGNQHIPTERIRAAITAVKVGELFNEEKIREDIRALNDLGVFADVTVRTEVEQEGVIVVFLVTENPIITEVVIEGNTVVSADEIRQALGVPTGEVLNFNRMRDGTRAVQKLYEDRGYVLARVTDTATVPVENAPDQARLRVRIAEGTIEAVRFEGLKKTRLSTVQRHIQETTKGTIFNVNSLNRDLQRLFDTGLFETLRARPEPGTEPDTAVVVIEVTETRTAQVGAGLGYSSRDGLIGFVEYRDRNWRGFGQTVAVRLERAVQTGSRFTYEVTFNEPFFDNKRTSFDASVYSRSTVEQEYGTLPGGASGVTSNFELLRTGSFIALTRPLDPVTTATVRFRSELTEINPQPRPSDGLTVAPSLLSPGRVISLSLGATRDTRNDRFNPTRGERISLTLESGLRMLGGDFGFTKYIAEYQRLFPVGRASVIVGRLLVGYTSGTLPLQERFLLGGSSTVRALPAGFARADSIGVVNLEYRFPLGTLIKQLGEMQGIVFVDAGSAPLSSSGLQTGFGVGVAFNTPIGPLRLDFAFGPQGRQTWISLGAPF